MKGRYGDGAKAGTGTGSALVLSLIHIYIVFDEHHFNEDLQWADAVPMFEPVSYTHLDVYKRQAHLRGIFSFAKEKQKKKERGEEDMAIYHLEAKVVSRGAGRSAVAASAYLSCSRLYNDYDGIQHDYTKKQGLVWQQMFLPEYAPQEWQDREKLWNAVEEVETAKDSRLAREDVYKRQG